MKVKNDSILCLLLAFIILGYSVWLNLRLAGQLKTIQRDHREEIAAEPSGGYEVPVERVEDTDKLLFPVSREDYLRLTSPYGVRISPFTGREAKHQGLDIAAVWRAQVVSVADGIVTEHWPPPGTRHPSGGVFRGHDIYGGMIRIQHDCGKESLYAHLSWSRVHQGMRVRAGEVIGRIGSTGLADGEHLHFELWIEGVPVNPLLWVEL